MRGKKEGHNDTIITRPEITIILITNTSMIYFFHLLNIYFIHIVHIIVTYLNKAKCMFQNYGFIGMNFQNNFVLSALTPG